ncbi:MAG: hypothetical protein QNJ05_06760 [Woeseiaceae bacterium]|nr:hypothetical protein [Woeseiaceae bacterium]
MRKIGLTVLATLFASGCGGTIDLSCDEPMLYQQAVESPRVVAPDDLTQLDEMAEMPIPEAAPAPPREPGQPCLDIPPRYLQEGDVVRPSTI